MEHLTGARERVAASGSDPFIPALVDVLPVPAVLVRLDDTIIGCNAEAAALLDLPAGRVGGSLRNLAIDRVAGLLSALTEIKDRLRPDDARQTGLRVDLGWAVVMLRPVLSDRGEVQAILISFAASAGTVAGGEAQVDGRTSTGSSGRSTSTPDGFAVAAAELSMVARLLRQLQGQLEEREFVRPAAQKRNEFLAMLAHELRNPLGAILSALHVIRTRITGDRLAMQALQVADRQARHQARLLDDLLDASRVVLGKIDLRFEEVNLGALLGEAMADARYLFQTRAQEVALVLPPEGMVLHGDPQRLEQVFSNLLSNAAKYTGPGGQIRITAERDGDSAVVRVRDTGIGIDPAMLPRIFDLFVQADSSLARSEGGLGIGLTLVQYVVRLHEGSVQARSEGRGRGSEFEVRLPLAASAARGQEPSSRARPGARSRRILIIEDNRDARQMLRTLLELSGHRVRDAANGDTGIKMAMATVPEVVLIDIGLPDIDGYAVAERLRKLLGGAVRLIALTGYGDAESRRRGLAEFDRYLVKPVAPDELSRALDSL